MNRSISIRIENPFSWKECLWFLDRGFDDCTYTINKDEIYRAFTINNEQHLICISCLENSLFISWLVGEPNEDSKNYISRFIADWFDLYTDLTPFYGYLSGQKELTYMVSAFSGLRLIGMPDLFESLIWGIIGQQINLTFAYKIKRRLVERYGTFLDYENNRHFLFPTPEVLSGASPADLRELQLSGKKAEYVLNVANLFANKTLSKTGLMALSDFNSRQKVLTAIKGIGIWTANYVLMKSMKERSCIPYGDAGLIKALVNHNLMISKQDLSEMDNVFFKFKGWESYLVFYLWRSLSVNLSAYGKPPG